jgi:RHS repeat-associated protein
MKRLALALLIPAISWAGQPQKLDKITKEYNAAVINPEIATKAKEQDESSSFTVMALAPPGGGGEPGGGGAALGIASEDIMARMKVDESVTPHTTDLLGERIDLNSGSVSFAHTDLVAKGNGLDIVVSRKFYPEAAGWASYNSSFLDNWLLELPAIHTSLMYNGNRYSGSWGIGKECSGELNPGPISDNGNVFESYEYWNGDSLMLPGGTQEKLLENNGRKTKSNWKFTCFNRAGGGEGFIGYSPNGLKYTFDNLRLVFSKNIKKDFKATPLYQAFMLATKVEDRFGNWIKYNYSNNKLTSITANDGRTVSFTYGTSAEANFIKTMTYNGRTWTYGYNTSSSKGLVSVTRPDGKSWSIDVANTGKPAMGTYTDMSACAYDTARRQYGTATITHPDGVTGTFYFRETLHGRSNTASMQTTSGGPYIQPQCYSTMSLDQKVLDGPGMSSMTWNYDYSENTGYKTGVLPSGSMLMSGTRPSNIDNKNYKWTQVTAPDGSKTKYFHNRNYASYLDGSMLAIEVFNSGGSKLKEVQKTVTSQYVGSAGMELSNNAPHSNRVLNTQNKDIYYLSGGNDVFIKDTTSYDGYGNPLATTEYNDANGGKKRHMQYTYDDDTTNWIIGRPLQTKISSDGSTYTEVSKTEYHSRTGTFKSLPKRKYSHGRWHTYYSSYHSNGLPRMVQRNATNQWVEYLDYYRGVPKTVRTPQSRSTSSQYAYRLVDANGWVTKITDFEGRCETYSYNNLGRLTLINPCDSYYADTSISYSTSTSGNGIPGTESGMLVQTVSRGDYRKNTYHDGLLRPVAYQEWDASDLLVTMRYVRNSFDYQNKPVFQSRPSASTSTSYGITNSYDSLGRVTSVDDNATSGAITYTYLHNDRVQVNDNRGYVTTTTYLSYGSPSQAQPTLIASPEGVSTSMVYDIFGNVTTISQGGENEYRVYDGYKQLCKTVREDVGPRAFSFDAVGQLIWEGYGSSVSTSAQSCDTSVSASEKTLYYYDNRGQVKTINHGNSQLVKEHYYDKNGNLVSLNAGGVVSTYTYNSQNALLTERLSVDGKQFNLSYGYDPLVNVSSMTYPSGATVSTTHNALGQQERVGSYATNAKYHPVGSIKSHSYGNLFAYSSSINNAGLPSYTHDVRSGVYAVKHGMTYDANNNLTFWDDQISNSYDFRATYDGLDRLNAITDSYSGTGDLNYDTLGNITQFTMNGQTNYYNYNSYKQLAYIYGRDSYSFGYDSRGNVTSNGRDTFSYNSANQMTSASGNSYRYDGHNRRVKKSDTIDTSYSMYTLSGQLVYRQVAGAHKDYYYLGNKLVATKKGSSVEYVHTDYLGSPAAYTTTGGSVSKRFHYEPFGETIESSAQGDDVAYTGHKFDKDIGLTYMQARYYDPVIGRFYSNDPVDAMGHIARGNPIHGFNRYTYANNNPYKYVDPDGEFGVLGFAIGFGLELGGQILSGQNINLTKATVMGLSGAITGGMASLAKSATTIGAKATQVVASTGDKIALGAIASGGGAVSAAGASAVNDSMDGKSHAQIVDNALESAVESVAPHVKGFGKAVGDFANKGMSKLGLGKEASDIGSQVVGQAAEKTISDSCSSMNNEC